MRDIKDNLCEIQIIRCLGQIPYFLFYPSSGTAGNMPQPFPIRVCLRSYFNSPSDPDSTSAVAHLMEGLTARMDHLRVIHFTSQPNPQISPLYGTLSPTGPSHLTSRVTPTAQVALYGSSRLMGWGILPSGSLHGYDQFLLSLLTLPDLSM